MQSPPKDRAPVAVVTGGSRGIGRALAERLSRDGYRLAILARSEGDLERAAKAIRSRRGECLSISVDVASASSVDRAFEDLAGRMKHIDLVVHCAGILEAGPYNTLPTESYARLMEVNYLGAVHVARAALRRMLATGGGHLVQVASVIAVRSFPGFAAYAPTKWALRAFHETLEAELRGKPVRLSIVYPPITDTGMIRALPRETRPAVYDAFRAVPAERVAERIVLGIAKGRRRIFVRGTDRLYFHLTRLAPGTLGRILDRRVARRAAR